MRVWPVEAQHFDAGIQRRTDFAYHTQHFQLLRDASAQRDQRRPIDTVRDHVGQLVPSRSKHRLAVIAWQKPPRLVSRERQNRREPTHHCFGDMPQRRLCGSPRPALRGCDVQTIFQHVEIQTTQIIDAKIMHLLINGVKLEASIRLNDFRLQTCRTL